MIRMSEFILNFASQIHGCKHFQEKDNFFRNHVNEIRKVSTYLVKGMTTMSGKD